MAWLANQLDTQKREWNLGEFEFNFFYFQGKRNFRKITVFSVIKWSIQTEEIMGLKYLWDVWVWNPVKKCRMTFNINPKYSW